MSKPAAVVDTVQYACHRTVHDDQERCEEGSRRLSRYHDFMVLYACVSVTRVVRLIISLAVLSLIFVVTFSTLNANQIDESTTTHGPTPGTDVTSPLTTTPTTKQTTNPTKHPTTPQTMTPTTRQTTNPTKHPTTPRTMTPTTKQTTNPTKHPTTPRTTTPTTKQTTNPTKHPTTPRTMTPTTRPTTNPTKHPTTPQTMTPTTIQTTKPYEASHNALNDDTDYKANYKP